MPTYRDKIHIGDKVPLIEADDLSDGAVTARKLAVFSITTDKIADGSITADKLAFDIVDLTQERKTSKGMVVYCSVFTDEKTISGNVGKVDTFLFYGGKLSLKTGERTDSKGNVVGVYKMVNLSKKDIYIDLNTELQYRWDGEKMVELTPSNTQYAAPLTDTEIDNAVNV